MRLNKIPAMKIITIIIPTYNMEAYLGACLSSLIIDRPERLEVIVVNDGSKDSSAQVAQQFIDKYPDTFRIINKENGNYGSCINIGLQEAHGKYIKVLDSDDSFDTANFAQMVSLLEQLNVDLFLTNTIRIKNTHESLKTLPYPKDTKFDFVSFLRKKDLFGKIMMHEVAYKREIFNGLNYKQSEGVFYTDNEWIFKPMAKVATAYYMSKPVYRYLLTRDGQSVSSDVMMKHLYDDVVVSIKLLRDYKEMADFSPALKNVFYNHVYRRAIWLYRRVIIRQQMFDNEYLQTFDKVLKEEAPLLYKKTGKLMISLPAFPFRYVSLWRKNPNSKLLRVAVSLYHIKKKIKL